MVQAPEMENDQEQLTVQQKVEMWEEKAQSQSSSLDRGLCESPRKPPGVRGSCRTVVPSQGAELTLTSGAGECETRVCDTDGEPQGHVAEPTGDVCLARLRARPQPLSMETLQGARDGLERCRELGKELSSCLELALERFCREPQCVQGNARLLIRWDGGELEFIAGQGQCEICVSCSAGEPQYHITEKTWDVFVAWTNLHPEPLSIKNLERVRNTLESWGLGGEELSGCFGEAISRFSREPTCVQENARLLIRWGGEELEFVSGKGECEITVSYVDGKPQYRAVKIPVPVYVARLCTHRPPLSADTLRRVLSELGSCDGDTGALRACFNRAWEGFSREPRCVQENARLLIRWGGEELAFVSGQGQCEISVLLADGEPQYHITELGGDRPETWSHASPEPLSVADLERVRDRLGRWGALGKELSGCFGEAISQFSREPPCVQGNARLRLCWDGGSLEFLSGEGQYEISVSYQEGNPRYHFHVESLPVDLYVTRLCFYKDPLTADSLLRFHTELGLCRGDTAELRDCFHTAWEGFRGEPRCVQENARLLIQGAGGELEFVSGQGQCEISVLLADGEPQYHITELGGDRPETWSHASPEPLSVTDLAKVWDRLGRWGALGEELSGCFGEAISQFSREPPCVQGNARMGIQCGRGRLEFLSGEGQCEISVRCRDERPEYEVVGLPVHMYLARLRARPEPLSADTLWRVLRILGSCQEDTGTLRACISHALDQFVQEPRCVQGNARLLIQWGGEELEFVSGQGQCEISVLLADGEPQYHITELGGDRSVTWSHASPEPLSVADLERVRDRLGRWGALGEELSGCFGEAISQFSREPRCVQGNARLRLCWAGGSLEFLSGEGQYEISVRYRDGRPQYEVGELPVHMYLARLRTRPDPLSADTLWRVWDKLGSCKGDRDDFRACFHCAWEGFKREPQYVQDNARLLIQWGRRQLRFTSGKGECEISVRCVDGKPQYSVGKIPAHVYVAQLRADRPPLSADTLQRVLSELGSCDGDTGALRACFDRACQGFHQEPQCVQGNARLLIQWGGGELEFVSGQGENLITVCECEEGRIQYTVQVSGWWPWIARLLISCKVSGRD
ncbi:dTDP-4-dehydrorhamnose reductase [Platysternon megacephalum]|uniref:dTDP-4-dehydrorhamnose reductase n=1 Tax=Platysternon megacephalum TaxID=55544 RepID=A0A4D9DFQ5_9SAUR|nr:dTDP-4-dehydrorhamnose reductase [Platysternon megacephalum]